MSVTLRDAELSDRGLLRQLLADYLFEFDGTIEPYPYFDAYWEEPGRLPLLIEANGDTVGLCLIRRRGVEWSIAEFSVLPDRRRGRGWAGSCRRACGPCACGGSRLPRSDRSPRSSFLGDGQHWGWYINFQRPFARTPGGVLTMDLLLDILVEHDCSAWHWNDEDEFEAMIEWGLIDDREVQTVRAEAASVIRATEQRLPPFSEPWAEWRPEPSWGIPALSNGP